ncbi:MAG: G5 domain-containing protein [Anaerolineae bacterium]|nr:G5 domain-containing protein [Anaerolineae bacterium]
MNLSNAAFTQKGWFFLLGLALLLANACQSQPKQVTIEVDGSTEQVSTEASTVREVLEQAKVELGALDRVSPDLYANIKSDTTIVVVRVTEDIEIEQEIVPFEQQTVVNEALPKGETRLAQLGVNGREEISIRVVYEDGEEISRMEIARTVVEPPIPEILVVGPQDSLPPVPIDGTIAYMSNDNAWLVRNSSNSRRALTTDSDLDGRVFSLSPDGRRLLYTTALTNEIELPLNELWLASTTIVGEKPITLGVQGILHAEWSPVLTDARIAYSTAERTPNPPGWRANNDLWLLVPPDFSVTEDERDDTSRPEPIEILPANTQGLYPWWGTTFVWSPDGSKMAYARADQIGVIDLETEVNEPNDRITPLLDFSPLDTFSDWVWVPGISWSTDGQFLAATVHGPPAASESAEESQVFDLWLLSIDGTISAKVAERVGMWSNPMWGGAGIAYGEALTPLQSVNSRYRIMTVDRDGSDRRQIFPFNEEIGVQIPELAWSPDNENLLFTYNGNLFITSRQGGLPRQITTDGQVTHPRWSINEPVVITATLPLTATPSLTVTVSPTATIDNTAVSTATPAITITRTPRQSPTLSPSVTRTSSSTPRSTATNPATATPRQTNTVTTTPSPRPTATESASATAQPNSPIIPPLLTPTLTITP